MLAVFIVDAVFTAAAVYLFLNDQVLPGVVVVAMGGVAAGVLLVRWLNDRRERAQQGPANAVRPETVVLTPTGEAEVRDLARRSKVAAVKRVRQLTGASLRAAVEYVEKLG